MYSRVYNDVCRYLDRVSEAIREFESIQERQEVVLCCLMALIYAHKKAKMIDKESVQEFEARLKQTRTSCGENALYFAGMFLWHTGRHDKAREYVDRMLKMSNGSKEVCYFTLILLAFYFSVSA